MRVGQKAHELTSSYHDVIFTVEEFFLPLRSKH